MVSLLLTCKYQAGLLCLWHDVCARLPWSPPSAALALLDALGGEPATCWCRHVLAPWEGLGVPGLLYAFTSSSAVAPGLLQSAGSLAPAPGKGVVGEGYWPSDIGCGSMKASKRMLQ